ncbi:hypothetical protein K503DRAFT_770574 [Rhizopogon vinicolor AM-OR11-026]|uniref:Uncharacterized protein n=1 Tax=Rhizopogon vinicolor AM-OR11-026 TaxID=1314800 RepID=A0A1B7N0I4_9AGAM|nr:hypothetical protein K503DRAFT_770574 [Rhizopogon vinicolor AM-OR11-026]
MFEGEGVAEQLMAILGKERLEHPRMNSAAIPGSKKSSVFYQSDLTLYIDDRSPNHKESAAIL